MENNVNKKPVLSAEVADAIESMRGEGWDNATIVDSALNPERYDNICSDTLSEADINTLMAALVNGYTRELTFEQRKEKLANEYKEFYDGYENDYASGIYNAVVILGIKIDGINS